MDAKRAEAPDAAILVEQLAYHRALGLAPHVAHTPRDSIHGAVTRLQRESS